jgi:hypothetical protein
LEGAAEDCERGGIVDEVMGPVAEAPSGAAIALRLMGSVHRLVLEGRAPELARFYPSTGGGGDPAAAVPVFLRTIGELAEEVGAGLQRSVQTNEVGRSAALLGGFLEVARLRPELRVLEIGSSAGLNLRWDHFGYEHDGASWGPDESPVHLDAFESAPDLSTQAIVVERAGCDPDPVDPTTDEGRLTLSSYVWPDQDWRWNALSGALEVAAQVPVEVERSGAAEWLGKRLAEEVDAATVVFHSIMWQYMSDEEQELVVELLHEAASRATEQAPFAWLRMEPPAEDDEDELGHVHLTVWPRGETRFVARTGYHGRPIIWLG